MAIEISNNCKMPIVDSSKGDIIAGGTTRMARARAGTRQGGVSGGTPVASKNSPSQYERGR